MPSGHVCARYNGLVGGSADSSNVSESEEKPSNVELEKGGNREKSILPFSLILLLLWVEDGAIEVSEEYGVAFRIERTVFYASGRVEIGSCL
jgi:hypothetical protein